MVGFKRGISALYAHTRDRAYTKIYTKQGRTDLGLWSSKKLRNVESGEKSLRWAKCTRITLHLTQGCKVPDKLLQKLREGMARRFNKFMAKTDYLFRFPTITHQILRNHPMAQGAGADRISRGMSKAFGKGFALAAVVRDHGPLLQVYVAPRAVKHLPLITDMCKNLGSTLPSKSYLITKNLKRNELLHA